jgi:hypothetical protein
MPGNVVSGKRLAGHACLSLYGEDRLCSLRCPAFGVSPNHQLITPFTALGVRRLRSNAPYLVSAF